MLIRRLCALKAAHYRLRIKMTTTKGSIHNKDWSQTINTGAKQQRLGPNNEARAKDKAHVKNKVKNNASALLSPVWKLVRMNFVNKGVISPIC